MTFWNKVFSAFSYLDDVRSGADDGQVGVSSARSEGSLQIFAVGVSIRRCSWLSFIVDLDLFFRYVLRQDLVSSTLCFDGKRLQTCVARGVPPADVLSAIARSRCKQRVVFAVIKIFIWQWCLQVFLSLPAFSVYF